MASVLFSTVGQALGGPLGAAIGFAVGSSVDSGLFGRRGQGAVDLFVQRSAYGEIVPRIYGRTRVAGHLIWALTPSSRGGKGSGRQAAATSIAIALSSGPIVDIGRIWADGREIRNADGKFEAATIMRVHKGDNGQQVDSLILAAEGAEKTPDYRNLSYVVFEELDLAPFGNRIPNLSFEVIADEAGPKDWLQELGRRAEVHVDPSSDSLKLAVGYSAAGEALTEVGLLARLGGFTLSYADGVPQFSDMFRKYEIDWADMLLETGAEPEIHQASRPGGVAFSYLDPERDYQAGRQRISRGRRGVEVENSAPVCATAGMALTLAGRQLRQIEASTETIRFGLSWKWMHLAVGDHVVISGRGPWRIIEREIRGMRIYCRAAHVAEVASLPIRASDPGRGQSMPMVPAGPTMIRLIESPVPLVAGDASAYVWLSGGPGWRGASARQLTGGDERILGEVREISAHAMLMEALESGPETVWDLENSLLLAVEPGLPLFESRSAADVLAGANLVMVGDEILQFCDAIPEGIGSVRLSRLLRGRFGTYHPSRRAGSGEIVVQIVPDRLLPIHVPADAIGREIVVLASGAGDPIGGTEMTELFKGIAAAPMAPVHLQVDRLSDGSVSSRWIVRSRDSWGWNSMDVKDGLWRWRFQPIGQPEVGFDVTEPHVKLSAAEQVALSGELFGAGTVTVESIGEGPREFRSAVFHLL